MSSSQSVSAALSAGFSIVLAPRFIDGEQGQLDQGASHEPLLLGEGIAACPDTVGVLVGAARRPLPGSMTRRTSIVRA